MFRGRRRILMSENNINISNHIPKPQYKVSVIKHIANFVPKKFLKMFNCDESKVYLSTQSLT